nr:hypothetical protein [Tanacetum cinerariifolium]
MFRINPSKTSREEKQVPDTIRASARTKPITVSQPHVITKKDVNFELNGLSSTGVDNTKTRRPQPRSNTKNLLLSKNNKHISSVCNNIKIDSHDVISKVVYAMCKKCLISVNHDKCLSKSVNAKNSCGKNQKAQVSVKEIQMKYQPKVSKPKNVGTRQSLATSKPRKFRLLLRWSPTGRLFNQGKLAASSNYKSQYDCSNGDNACTSNVLEPKIKRFLNSTSLLDRKKQMSISSTKTSSKLEAEITSSSYGFMWTNENCHYKWKAIRFGDCGRLLSLHVVERRNWTLVEAARTMLIFSRAPLFLWAEAIATACFTQNRSIIHRRFNKTPYELINDRKPDILFLHVFGALCSPKNDREDIGKLSAKGDIGFFIGSKPRLQSMTSGHISSGLDLTYAPLTITTQQPSEGELDLLFEAMYDDYVGGQPSATARTVLPAQEPQVRQASTASTTIADTAPIPTNSSFLATNIPITSQDVDELNPNAMVDGNTFVNPFANSSTSAVASSSQQNVDPSNMHTIDGHQKQISSCRERVPPRGRNQFRRILRSGFIDVDHPSHVYKLKKALYGLKQAPRAWYIQLFSDLMKSRFEMSMMGEMTFFLGLQVNQSPCGIFINQSKYVLEILNKYGMESCDPIGTPMEIKDKLDLDQNGTPGTVNTGLWYTKDSGFELTGFSYADYAGCKDTFKSTSSGAQILGEKLFSWSSKKQDCTALSTAKAEYVSLSACLSPNELERLAKSQ